MSKTKTRRGQPAPSRRPPADDTPHIVGFGLFRKHQKAFLWFAVVFSVLVFGLFAAMSDLQALLQGGQRQLYATYVVPATGETVELTRDEFGRVNGALRRLAGNRRDVTDDHIWAHILMVADAKAAGLRVSDAEVRSQLGGNLSGLTDAQYRAIVQNQYGFLSVREFEETLREQLLARRWIDLAARRGSVVDADSVYLRWRVDNEVFDLDALAFADLDPAAMPDPTPDELRAWWDEMPEKARSVRFREPARWDVVAGWLSLDADLSELPEEQLAALPEPQEAELEQRFKLVGADRFPGADALTDEARAVLAGEIKVIRHVQAAFRDFNERDEEARTKEAFLAVLRDHGLQVEDPEGHLGPEELAALPVIGGQRLVENARIARRGVHRLITPYGGDTQVLLVYYEDGTDARPLEFEEAGAQARDAWKDERRDRPAQEFREALAAAARELPEARAEIAPLEQAAAEAAQARIDAAAAAGEEIDAEAVRAEELAAMAPAIETIVAGHEGRAFVELAGTSGGELRSLVGVPRSYRFAPDETEDAASLERFLKTNGSVFAVGVDGVTPLLRHGPSGQSVVVRVAGRTLPGLEAMFADPAGMARSRDQLMRERAMDAQFDAGDPELLKASHQVRLVQEEGEPDA